MRTIFHLACFAALVAVAVQGDCSADLNTCTATYNQTAPAGANAGVLCKAGNAYVRCLRDLAQRADCSSLVNHINEERRKAEERLNQHASGCMHCTAETETCMGTYNSSSARDRGNVTAICKDGQTYVLCLRKVDKTIECTNEKTQVADERRKAQEKLTQAGCDTGAECLAGVDKCQADMKQAQGNRQHTEVVDCKIAQTYHNCLKTQETGGNCTGAFAAELKYAMDDITAQEKAGNCSAADAGPGGAATDLRATGVVMATVVLTALALQ